MSEGKKYVLYHSPCTDGFGAAWASWLAFSNSAEYIPVKYGQDPPEMEGGSEVYILDFSYPRHILEQMYKDASNLVVLDHHRSAEKELSDLPYAQFDMERSGAVMAWNLFWPEYEVPPLLKYIQDRDLWRFDLKFSKSYNAAISSYPRDFGTWSTLDRRVREEAGDVLMEGWAIRRAMLQAVELTCKDAFVDEIGGYYVPIVNCTTHVSEVGHRLLEMCPDAPFSASYRDTKDESREFSLRSRGDFDVSVIAKSYGGGGHKSAAGFRTKLGGEE